MSEAKIKQAVDELTRAPQGVNDSDMPMPPSPAFGGEVGTSPSSDAIPPGDPSESGGGKTLTETGEEPDPAVFDAGGVAAPDTDGMSRTHPGGD